MTNKMLRTESSIKSITDLTQESVHTADDVDIGDIEAMDKDSIVVKRGFVNVHYCYIPLTKVEGWDEQVVWLTITEREVKDNYEKNTEPDPSKYYIKDKGYGKLDSKYTITEFPEVKVIPRKGKNNKTIEG